jgi:hypothetical protein
VTRPNLDPDELLTKARQAITRGLQLQADGDQGPAMAWLGGAAKAIEDLDAYLTMGGRLPSQWRRAKPAAAPSAVDRSTVARCGQSSTAAVPGTFAQCSRLRGHRGNHRHELSGLSWR